MRTIGMVLGCALLALSICMLPGTAVGQAQVSARGGGAYDSWGSAYDMSAQVAAELGYSFPLGPFTVRPHFGVWAGYDDNVYLQEGKAETTKTVDVATGEVVSEEGSKGKVDDVFITLAPGLMLIYGNPSHNYISMNYTLELPRYIDESDANYESHHLSTDLHYESAKHTYHLADRFMQTEVKDIEIGERVEKTQNVLSADIERMLSSKTSIGVQGLYEIHDYQKESYVDYDEYRAGGRFYYRITPKTDIFADIGYGWVDLDSEQFEDDDYGDAEYQEFSLGVRGKLGKKTTIIGRAGYHRREFDGEDEYWFRANNYSWSNGNVEGSTTRGKGDILEPIEDWIASLDMMTRFSSRFQGGLEISRRLFPSIQTPGDTSVSTTVNPYMRYQLWRNRISLSLSVAYSIVEFYPAETVSYSETTWYGEPDDAERVSDKDREDEYWEYVGIIDWKSSKHITLGVGYAYSEQETNQSDAKSENGRIIVRAMFNY